MASASRPASPFPAVRRVAVSSPSRGLQSGPEEPNLERVAAFLDYDDVVKSAPKRRIGDQKAADSQGRVVRAELSRSNSDSRAILLARRQDRTFLASSCEVHVDLELQTQTPSTEDGGQKKIDSGPDKTDYYTKKRRVSSAGRFDGSNGESMDSSESATATVLAFEGSFSTVMTADTSSTDPWGASGPVFEDPESESDLDMDDWPMADQALPQACQTGDQRYPSRGGTPGSG